jgi:CBS-domain-containing membrane protein
MEPLKHTGSPASRRFSPEISDADITAGLEDMHAYIDVSNADLATIYRFALQHAYERIAEKKKTAVAPLQKQGINYADIAWATAGTLVGIGLCAVLSAWYFEPRDLSLLIGSFGASAVLVYGAVKSPLAQPRNLVGGHLLSAVAGVVCAQIFGENIVLAAPFSVALAVGLMLATRTLHPPGGATALIAVIGGEKIRALGFLYPFIPVAAGALIMLVVALAVNNLSRHRTYPESW